MKSILLLFICLIIAGSFYAQKDLKPVYPKEVNYVGNRALVDNEPLTGMLIEEKTNRTIGIFINGYKDGIFKENYSNGNKKSETSYSMGIKNGLETLWFENGNKKSSKDYLDGDLNGLCIEWSNNGYKKYEETYLHGNIDGKSIEYDENGKIKSKAEYSKNILNGESQEFYKNGNLMNSTIYLDGQKNGKCSEWHENGKLKKEIIYNNDKISDGKFIEFDDSGQKNCETEFKSGIISTEYSYKDNKYVYYHVYPVQKKSEGYLINGIKNGYWNEWFENGQKSFEGEYINGNKEGRGIEYDDTGTIVWNGDYKEGRINGIGVFIDKFKTYNGEWIKGIKNGNFIEISSDKIKAEGQYINDIKDGKWTVWFSNGNKMTESNYTDGKIVNGNYNEWYENGKNKEEKTYLDSQLDGKHTKWFDNGNLSSMLVYDKGIVVDGRYFNYNSIGGVSLESNYINGKLRSVYSCIGSTKDGSFTEYYADGSKKIEGRYNYDKRIIEERYGSVLKSHNFIKGVFRGIGTTVLLVGLLYLSALTN